VRGCESAPDDDVVDDAGGDCRGRRGPVKEHLRRRRKLRPDVAASAAIDADKATKK
jgi:hypothetical protein